MAALLSASTLALLALQGTQAAYLPTGQLLPRQSAVNETASTTCPVPEPLQTVWEAVIAPKNAKGEDGSRQNFGPPNVGASAVSQVPRPPAVLD